MSGFSRITGKDMFLELSRQLAQLERRVNEAEADQVRFQRLIVYMNEDGYYPAFVNKWLPDTKLGHNGWGRLIEWRLAIDRLLRTDERSIVETATDPENKR